MHGTEDQGRPYACAMAKVHYQPQIHPPGQSLSDKCLLL